MRELKDRFGQPVSLGDAVIYAVKHSCDVEQHYAFIYGIELRAPDYILKVVSMRKRHSWDGGVGKYVFYKTTLTAANFIRIPMASVQIEIREELLKHLP